MNKIYFTGYDAMHGSHFMYDETAGFNYYLLLLTTTPARFWVDGQIEEYPAHSAILYTPGQKIWYAASGDIYGDHWIRFETDEPFVKNFPLTARPFSVSDPEYYRCLFQMITWETSHWLNISRPFRNAGTETLLETDTHFLTDSNATSSEQTISMLLRILFQKLKEDALQHSTSPHDQALLMLRKEIYNTPQFDWNVRYMADSLHLSMGYLQLIYKQKFGISCIDDVIESRLRRAKDLLIGSGQSIGEVAEKCGYRNTEHFCRQFKKNVGMSPGKYREMS